MSSPSPSVHKSPTEPRTPEIVIPKQLSPKKKQVEEAQKVKKPQMASAGGWNSFAANCATYDKQIADERRSQQQLETAPKVEACFDDRWVKTALDDKCQRVTGAKHQALITAPSAPTLPLLEKTPDVEGKDTAESKDSEAPTLPATPGPVPGVCDQDPAVLPGTKSPPPSPLEINPNNNNEKTADSPDTAPSPPSVPVAELKIDNQDTADSPDTTSTPTLRQNLANIPLKDHVLFAAVYGSAAIGFGVIMYDGYTSITGFVSEVCKSLAYDFAVWRGA